MVKSGVLERVNRGIYQIADAILNGQGLGDSPGDGYTDLEKVTFQHQSAAVNDQPFASYQH